MTNENTSVQPLRILHIEDSALDAEIIRENLIDAGLEMELDRAGNESEFVSFLKNGEYDLILADYKIPGFEAPEVFRTTKELCPDIPFICVSGAVGEEKAVELLKMGATDYIPKNRLNNLPRAIQRAIDEARERTARKYAETAQASSEKKFRTLFEDNSDAVMIQDDHGFVDCNRTTLELFGCATKDEFCTKHPADCSPPLQPCGTDSFTLANSRLAEALEKGKLRFEWMSRRLDNGAIFVSEVLLTPMELDGKRHIMATVRDVSERKQAEEDQRSMEQQLQQAQKLESLGVLAGGIAHDFNNILMAIMGNADLALMRINKESPAVDNLRRIEQSAARAADLAKQMLAYSGKGKFVVELIDMGRLVEEMLNMMEVSISKKAVLRLNLANPLPSVEADATQMRQIIMNLVINASEAIGDKSGIIAISTGCMKCDKNYLKNVWLNESLLAGLYVYVEVSDTGCGMDSDTMAKIFDPFFTTKFMGRGLGMAAVLGIVRGHKGAIKVYSEPGKGTSFKILLPAVELPVEIFNGNTHADKWRGTGTVLLVDDEETVRAIGSEMLSELGFTVVTAEDGRDALEVFKARNDIDLVILDLTMPHLDGEQCFRELRQIKPDLKVIISSGFNQQEVTQRFAGKGLSGFIQKPYRLSALSEVLKGI
jgi:PAS domain S-box-containing protein